MARDKVFNLPEDDESFEIINDLTFDEDEDDDIENEEEEDAEIDEQEEEEEGSDIDSETSEDGDNQESDEEFDFEKDAVAQYQARMKAIGGRFDESGRLTFDVPNYVPTDDDYIPPEVAVKQELLKTMTPIIIDNAITNAVQKNNKLSPYVDDVRALLNTLQGVEITPQIVESYFYYVRGQKADIEIAKVVKEKGLKIEDKVKKGKAAASISESPGKKVNKSTKDAPIDNIVAKLGDAWGLDKQTLANKLAEKSKRSK